MTINRQSRAKVNIDSQPVQEVDNFQYLGSCLSKKGGTEEDVKSRIGKASGLFHKMEKIWKAKSIDTNIKLRLFNTIILPTATYACETWKFSKTVARKLDTFQQKCLRKILGISYRSRTTNEEVLIRSNSRSLQETVTRYRLRFAGHIPRMPSHRHPKIAIEWIPKRGKRKQGRPRKTWRSTFKEDLLTIQIPLNKAVHIVEDREKWKSLVALCATHRRN